MPSLNMTFVKRTKQWKTIFSCPICWIESYYFKKTIGTLSYSNLKLKYSNRMSFTEKSQVYKYLQNMQVASRVEEKRNYMWIFCSRPSGWNDHTAILEVHISSSVPWSQFWQRKGKSSKKYPPIKSWLNSLSKTTLASFCNSVSGIESQTTPVSSLNPPLEYQ